MKKRSFWHRVSIRWKAFWRNFDLIVADYHRDKVAHPEKYWENTN